MTFGFEKQGAALLPLLNRYFSQGVFPDQVPLERLTNFQQEALKEVVRNAYERSPFYRQKMIEAGAQPEDIKSLADLAKIPFTTKEELRQDPWALLACNKQDIGIIHISTGTTGGKEIYSMHSLNDYYFGHSIIYPKLMPVTEDDLCFIALPYEMSSAGLQYQHKFMIGYHAAVVPVGKGGAYSTPQKTINAMHDLKPSILVSSPSYAITLAEAAAQISFDLTGLNLKKMWIGGEGCSSALRKRVEKIFGTTVNFSYGSMECGDIGKECDAHNGYHVSMAHIFVEIVDPITEKVLKPGEVGEIVLTSLLNVDTPVIRYRTQDLGYLTSEPCRCGVTLQRLYLRGRRADQIMIKGKAYSPYYLEEFLMQMPEIGNWYQFIVKAGNNEQLRIRIEPAVGIEPSPELARLLADKLQAVLGFPCELEFVDKLPRPGAKTVRVVRE